MPCAGLSSVSDFNSVDDQNVRGPCRVLLRNFGRQRAYFAFSLMRLLADYPRDIIGLLFRSKLMTQNSLSYTGA